MHVAQLYVRNRHWLETQLAPKEFSMHPARMSARQKMQAQEQLILGLQNLQYANLND